VRVGLGISSREEVWLRDDEVQNDVSDIVHVRLRFFFLHVDDVVRAYPLINFVFVALSLCSVSFLTSLETFSLLCVKQMSKTRDCAMAAS